MVSYAPTALAMSYVRSRATAMMNATCVIERVSKPSFDQKSGTASPGAKKRIYSGPCRIFEVSGGSPVMISEDEVTMQNTRIAIPWDVDVLPERNDEVQITACPQDSFVVGTRYVIDSSVKAGQLRATRSFLVRGYEKS